MIGFEICLLNMLAYFEVAITYKSLKLIIKPNYDTNCIPCLTRELWQQKLSIKGTAQPTLILSLNMCAWQNEALWLLLGMILFRNKSLNMLACLEAAKTYKRVDSYAIIY